MEGLRRGGQRAARKIWANFSLLRTLVRAYPAMSNSAATPTPLSYKDAGVDIDAGDALVERIKPLAKKTMREGVLAGIGGFGALFEVPKRYKEPVLVSGTDGVGTKLKLAFEWNMHDTVGIDLVAMSVNDVLVQGAEPLFFLDYFACGKLDVDTAAAVVGGIAKGCELSGCALIGGETAEMPGMYPAGEYDLAGFAVGAVEKSKILTGQTVQPGDVVLGLASHGVHSNGFSLVRKCIDRAEAAGNVPATLDGKPFKQAIMEPTRLYVKNVLAALAQHPIKALAHITGGGLLENIPRVLPEGTAAHLTKGSWPQTELFAWLQKTAGIDDIEMNRTFNNGIGMVVVVDAANAEATAATLRAAGEQVYTIGAIAPRGEGAAVVVG
ncbi:phosphoribosylformylglycinamidine cyclo-ligase [Acidovorax sp. 106]|nr:phosphoribosylformylglycinamidine cyclo-ligase [Acidovorax sp. 106]